MATYVPLEPVPLQFMDNSGDPLTSGTLYFYDEGTTTAQQLFSDNVGTSIGTSIALNSWGMPESGGNTITLFRDQSKSLKIVLKNSSGSTIWTSDGIPAFASFDSTSSTKLDGIEALADVTDLVNVGAVVNGVQEKWVSISEMYLPTTNPAGALATVEATPGLACYRGFPYDGATEENVEFVAAFPKRWNNGTITAKVYWTSAATDTDGVTWGVRAAALGDDEYFAGFYGTPQTIDDTLLGAAGKLHISPTSSAITVGGAVASGKACMFRVHRAPDNANDTATEDAVLLGVKLFYTSSALNDA